MPHQCYKSIRGYISLQRSFLLPKSVLPFSLKNYRCVWSITRTYVFQNSYFCRDVEQPVNGTLFFQRQAGDGCATVKAVPSTEELPFLCITQHFCILDICLCDNTMQYSKSTISLVHLFSYFFKKNLLLVTYQKFTVYILYKNHFD